MLKLFYYDCYIQIFPNILWRYTDTKMFTEPNENVICNKNLFFRDTVQHTTNDKKYPVQTR